MTPKNLFLILFIIPVFGFAQPMKLDSSFNNTGIVARLIDNQPCFATTILIQPDGKLLTTGLGSGDFVLLRLNADGTTDTSFGAGGEVNTDLQGNGFSRSIAVQPDGKILTAGTLSSRFIILRYNSNGSIDTSFNSTGIDSFYRYPNRNTNGGSVVIQPDGKIIASGFVSVSSPPSYEYFVIRYNNNGRADSTFGVDGFSAPVNFGISQGNLKNPILLQPDGKIVLGNLGRTDSATIINFALTRFNSNGSLDTTFGTNGIIKTDFDNTQEGLYSLELQGDGKIIAVGIASVGFNKSFGAVARYHSNGTLDTTYGTLGKVMHLIGDTTLDFIGSALQADGKLLATGNIYDSTHSGRNFITLRYDINGNLDTTFANGGVLNTHVGSGDSYAQDIAIQNDGKLVVVGGSELDSTTTDQFTIVRYALISPSISGVITTETGTPVPGVTVTLSGDDLQTTVSDSSGRYGFSVTQGGSYSVTPSRTNDVVTNNGITLIDILLTRRHLLGTSLSTPYKIIAADVDASNSVSTSDILLMRSMILQNISTFPNGRLWSFVPSDHVFADLLIPFPFPTSKTYNNLQQSMPGQDFIGIKLGDVNDSWNAGIP